MYRNQKVNGKLKILQLLVNYCLTFLFNWPERKLIFLKSFVGCAKSHTMATLNVLCEGKKKNKPFHNVEN